MRVSDYLDSVRQDLRYAVRGLDEARAYAAHPVLGPRLAQACDALLALPGDDPVEVLGQIDAVKLRSCLTLFAATAAAPEIFSAWIDRYFAGQRDPLTQAALAA